jgi:G3E family GTPase
MVSFFVLQQPDWEKLMAADREDDSELSASYSDSENGQEDQQSAAVTGSSDLTTAQQLQEVAGVRRTAFEARFGLLLRSKGFVWLATRGGHIGEWSQAGSLLSFSTGGAAGLHRNNLKYSVVSGFYNRVFGNFGCTGSLLSISER